MSTADPVPYEWKQTREEAELVLANAAERGIDLPQADIDAILSAVRVSDPKASLPHDGEMAFWGAFARATKAIRPVTIASLKATTEHVNVHRFFVGPKVEVPIARAAVTRYRRWALFALAMLFVPQILSIIGGALLKSADGLQQQLTDVRAKVAERKSQAGVAPATDETLQNLEAKTMTYEMQLETTAKLLSNWTALVFPTRLLGDPHGFEAPVTSGSNTNDDDADARVSLHATLIQARTVLSTIDAFVLPLFYGWLGACAYVLRRLGDELSAVTFSSSSEAAYQLRMPLGALAGMAIGWFLQPNPVVKPDDLVIRSLSAPALAFLAGYSVELLFAVMDAIISALSTVGKKPQP